MLSRSESAQPQLLSEFECKQEGGSRDGDLKVSAEPQPMNVTLSSLLLATQRSYANSQEIQRRQAAPANIPILQVQAESSSCGAARTAWQRQGSPSFPMGEQTVPPMLSKRDEKRELVSIIGAHKDRLFGKSSSAVTPREKSDVWERVFNVCRARGHAWTVGRDADFLRRIKWPGIKHDALRRRERDGGGGPRAANPLDEMVFEILGWDVPAGVAPRDADSADRAIADTSTPTEADSFSAPCTAKRPRLDSETAHYGVDPLTLMAQQSEAVAGTSVDAQEGEMASKFLKTLFDDLGPAHRREFARRIRIAGTRIAAQLGGRELVHQVSDYPPLESEFWDSFWPSSEVGLPGSLVFDDEGNKVFKIVFDVRRLKPNEISVSTSARDNTLHVAVSHRETGLRFDLNRHFEVPQGVVIKELRCRFTAEGLLQMQAPYIAPPEPSPRGDMEICVRHE